MSDLLEFLLNAVLEVVCTVLDGWVGWRFYLPLLGSVGIAALIYWLTPGSGIGVLAPPVLLTGVATGIIWQVRNG